MKKIILIAGATGNLGFRIVSALASKGVTVRALVRSNSHADKIKLLEGLGIEIFNQMNLSPKLSEKIFNWEVRPVQGDINQTSNKELIDFN